MRFAMQQKVQFKLNIPPDVKSWVEWWVFYRWATEPCTRLCAERPGRQVPESLIAPP